MSQPRSPTVTGSNDASDFSEVFRAELAVVVPRLALPATVADEKEDLASLAGALDHPETEDLAALCISGGGIRSASFSLGVLQGLARFGVLEQFHYLSTVSGGGYIGSWLSAWRSSQDDEQVFAALNSMQAIGAEPSQITGIRCDSNYVTPKIGLFSADTWTVIAIYIRNLLLNWVLFLPLFTGFLLIPHLCTVTLAWALDSGRPSAPWLASGCLLLTISLACAVCGRFRAREQWLTQARFLRLVLAPMVLSAICFTIGAALGGIHTALPVAGKSIAAEHAAGAVAGAVIYALSWLIGRVAANRWDEKVLPLDLLSWILAGAVVGFLISLGLQSVEGHHHARPLAVLGLSGVVLAYLVGDVFYVGAASLSRRGDMDREWLARASGWLAAVAVSWAVVSALSVYGSWLLQAGPRFAKRAWAQVLGIGIGTISGIVTLLLGPSTRTAATRACEAEERLPFTRIASIAAVIFAASIGLLLSILGQRLAISVCYAVHGCDTKYDPYDPAALAWLDPLVIAILIVLSFVSSRFVNVNRFSLHAMYRNRLVRAFLGSARADQRSPDPFTGFDPADNAPLATVVPRSGKRLFHVINTTLNVVATRNTAWQERKAESFAMTRLYCGNRYVGYRPTSLYGGKRGGITLGTAMAISGAAVSPNQGYNSSPLVGLLLTLFNVRLGWWLGNPASRKCYKRQSPYWSITPALKELAGATTDQGRWIYLSDGGHFDNLGLYEMLRRRCRCIVVIDAGCDPDMKLQDLGNAVRKSYIDFGVSIDFCKLEFQARQRPPIAGARFGLATISYPKSSTQEDTPRTGWLLYIKPTFYCTTEGVDIRGYASDHPSFPHESTTDQWFSESQLEAYRALGAHIIEHICSGGPGLPPGVIPPALSLESLHSNAEGILKKSRPR